MKYKSKIQSSSIYLITFTSIGLGYQFRKVSYQPDINVEKRTYYLIMVLKFPYCTIFEYLNLILKILKLVKLEIKKSPSGF